MLGQIEFLTERAKRQDAFSAQDLRLMLIHIIISLIFNWTVIGKVWDVITAPRRSADAVHQVRDATNKLHLTSEQAKEVRVVCQNWLRLHARRNGRAAVLGHVGIGQVVVLVEKRGKWCLVVSGVNEGGWVRSKYLKRAARH